MAQESTFHAEFLGRGEVALYLRGRLDHEQSGDLWRELSHFLQQHNPGHVICDLKHVTGINTAGVALLRLLEQRCSQSGTELVYRNLPEIARRFFQAKTTSDWQHGLAFEPLGIPAPVNRVGAWVAGHFRGAHQLLYFLGEVVAAGLTVLRHPSRFRWDEFFRHLEEVGVKAVLLICILNALTGLIMVYQGLPMARSIGADILIVDMVVRSVVGAMAPVLTAILIAGRSGAAFAANIGTMKIRQEVDLLSVLNLNITGFLVLPRVLAVAVATPLLIILAFAFGVFGGMVTSNIVVDIPVLLYLEETRNSLEASMIYSGLMRGAVFGMIIGLTGCFQGMQTGASAGSVGLQATSATVKSIILIIMADTVFAISPLP